MYPIVTSVAHCPMSTIAKQVKDMPRADMGLSYSDDSICLDVTIQEPECEEFVDITLKENVGLIFGCEAPALHAREGHTLRVQVPGLDATHCDVRFHRKAGWVLCNHGPDGSIMWECTQKNVRAYRKMKNGRGVSVRLQDTEKFLIIANERRYAVQLHARSGD